MSTDLSLALIWTLVSLGTLFGVLLAVYMQPSWLMALVVRCSHPSVLWCVSTSSRVCALTIDDAPSASTPLILDLLREHGVKATFFIISGNTHGREDVVKRIVREGHRLGNHLTEDRASILDELHVFEQKISECDAVISSYQDKRPGHMTTTEPEDSDEDMDTAATADATTRLLNQASKPVSYAPRINKWLRPASGWFTSNMRDIIARHGYRICMGSVYPHDAQIKSERLNAMHLKMRTSPGSVIIVHDRAWTVGVLREALPHLVRKFKFVSLDELTQHHRRIPHEGKRSAIVHAAEAGIVETAET